VREKSKSIGLGKSLPIGRDFQERLDKKGERNEKR